MSNLNRILNKHMINSSNLKSTISITKTKDPIRWYVMRDLKRSNTKLPAYKMLGNMGFEVFTPMVWKLISQNNKRIPIEVPFMQDLLFVHSSREKLDPVVEQTGTLQYRYLRDGKRTPMIVNDMDMERFKRAVEATDNHYFYTPKEVRPEMIGKKVRIVGGPLDGYEGYLQKLQGSRVKRLLIKLSNLLTAAVEVQPEFVQIVK